MMFEIKSGFLKASPNLPEGKASPNPSKGEAPPNLPKGEALA
jgi:hypothetical protein